MSIKRIALLLVAPAALAHVLAIPMIADAGSVLDMGVAQALVLAGLGGYSLVGGALAYRYAAETSRSPWLWTLVVVVCPFAAPFVLGCLPAGAPPSSAPRLLPAWRFEPELPVPQVAVPETIHTNPDWGLSFPVPEGWRLALENVLDHTGRFVIADLAGKVSVSGQATISVNAEGCAYTFSPEEIVDYAEGRAVGAGSVEELLKVYHDTYKDAFMNAEYAGHEILTEGACALAGLPTVMFLGSFLRPTGRVFEKQITMFGPGGACRYLCSMPEEQRPAVEAYFHKLVHSCAPFVGTNLWTAKFLELEPISVPLTAETRAGKTWSLPVVTAQMLEPDATLLTPPPAEASRVREWQSGSFITPDLIITPRVLEVEPLPVMAAPAAPLVSAPSSQSDTMPLTAPAPERPIEPRTAVFATVRPTAAPESSAVSGSPAGASPASEPVAERLVTACPVPSRPVEPQIAAPVAARAGEGPATSSMPAAAASSPTPEQLVAPEAAGPIVSWGMGRGAARSAPARPVAAKAANPLATWKVGRNTGDAPAQPAAPGKTVPAPGEDPAACARCGKPVLSRAKFLRELSVRHGIEIVRDNSGRLKIHNLPTAEKAHGTADIRATINALQQDRALRCARCGTVFCQNCLADGQVEARADGGKTCLACQSPELVDV